MNVTTRKSWKAKPPGPLSKNSLDKDSVLFVHWSAASGHGIDTVNEQKATMRAIQSYHQDVQGWSDIGYSYVVFQPRAKGRRVRVFEGRLFKHVPAAQTGHNTGNGAVCVVMGPGDELKDGTVAALRQIFSHFPGRNVKGHRDVQSTECPGDKLYRRLRDVRRVEKKRKPFLP